MYEPYPVPEQVREQKLSRYSSLWTFAKQDLRLFIIFSNYCRFSRFRYWVFLELYLYRLRGVFLHSSCVLYIWSMTGLRINLMTFLQTLTGFGGIVI